MIEQEIIKQYPSLVARPYLLIKDDFQRKDMQRFWFENTISFLAVLSAAELVKYYKSLKGKEEKSEKDLKTIQELQEHKSLTMVGLEHMALGKWVMMLRETTKTLQEYSVTTTVPELVEFYHGKNGKNNAKTIDKIVSIRNDDAHGNPIPEDKLSAELDKRQKLIDSLLNELTFLSDYQLILPEKLEIEGSKQYYMCKQFIGNDLVNTKQTFEFSPQISEVMLINQTKKDERLSLNPLLLYLGVQDEENDFLGIFSKYSSKDGTEAKYLNLDGSGTIDLVNFGQSSEIDLMSDRQSYNEIYSDPESFQVNLNVEMKFEESSIDITNKEGSSFSLLINNSKSTDIEKAKVVLDIPKNINIVEVPKCDESCSAELVDSQLIIKFDNFEDNQKVEIAPLKYTISEQGSYSLDSGRVLYEYYRTLADKESGQLTEEEILFEGVVIEANDPNSRDKMVPVININKGFVDEDENPIQNVRIGENFIFKVVVTNIGFSSAKNVMIDLVFPDNINLKQGKETITLGQLNPFEVKTFKYVLSSHLPDIYTITMQNVLYTDSQNIRHSTRCADEHFIIVRSDLIKEFMYKVKDHIDDLYIDDEEKENIISMIKTLVEATSIDAEQTYKEAETEAVIKIVRDLVEKTAAKKDLQVVEKIYEEGKRDSKITNSNPRKFLIFSSKEMPFFAINLSKGYEPEFFALSTNIDKRFDKVVLKQAVVKEGSYTLDHSIDFSEIKYDEKYGKDFFAQWLNIILTRFSKEYLTWKELTENIGKVYGGPLKYHSGYFTLEYDKNASNESGVTRHHTFIDRNDSQSYYVSFDCSPSQSFKKIMSEHMEDKSYFTFLSHTSVKDRVRLYNAKNLSYYLQTSDTGRASKYPAISLSIRDEQSMDSMMEKTQELWEYLCLSHSLDLLDNDDFKGQNFIEEMKQFVEALFEKGFALRVNEKDKNMLDIYPLKYFKPHTATERDCIGFIKKSYSGWQIFLDFFVNEIDDELADELSLITGNTILDKVRWIKLDIKSIEQLNMLTKTVLKQAEQYNVNKLAIWPSKMQRDMILNHGQTDSGFFIVLKNILSGVNNYKEILEDFKSMALDKELDRTLKRSELFPVDAGYESPLFLEGEDENKVIHINPALEDTLQLLYEEDSSFNYLEEGPALFRIQTKLISQKYEYLSNRTPYNGGMVDNSYKANNKFFKVCLFLLNPLKDKKVEFSLVFYDCKEAVDELIEKTYVELNGKFNNELVFGRSGHKNQHIKVTYIYSFNNFDEELEKMQTICHDFFTEAENGIEKLNEKG